QICGLGRLGGRDQRRGDHRGPLPQFLQPSNVIAKPLAATVQKDCCLFSAWPRWKALTAQDGPDIPFNALAALTTIGGTNSLRVSLKEPPCSSTICSPGRALKSVLCASARSRLGFSTV